MIVPYQHVLKDVLHVLLKMPDIVIVERDAWTCQLWNVPQALHELEMYHSVVLVISMASYLFANMSSRVNIHR